nr:hypothetical protein CFP56_41234 [Quercus suber]
MYFIPCRHRGKNTLCSFAVVEQDRTHLFLMHVSNHIPSLLWFPPGLIPIKPMLSNLRCFRHRVCRRACILITGSKHRMPRTADECTDDSHTCMYSQNGWRTRPEVLCTVHSPTDLTCYLARLQSSDVTSYAGTSSSRAADRLGNRSVYWRD